MILDRWSNLPSKTSLRHAWPFSLVLLMAAPAAAQAGQPVVAPGSRKVTVLGGLGNSMGWFGAQVEGYFADERASVFGGLGYTPEIDRSWSGIAVAAGLRLFTSGEKHRLFLEASVSQLRVEQPRAPSLNGDEKAYGPGLQAGYQFTTRSGFTLMLSAGVGQPVGAPSHLEATAGMAGLGLGYTWRAR
jgi:opacity protein-like surface antigen